MTKKKRIIIAAIVLAAAAVILLGSLVLVVSLVQHKFVFNLQIVSGWLGIIAVGFVLWWVSKKANIGKEALRANKDLEDTLFLTKKEIKQNKGLIVTKFSKLGEVADGMPVFAEAKAGDIDVVLSKPIHTLVIGTTGSGKTTTFVDPTIEILARTKTKPSMVITDPKGELYTNHAATLRKQGYDVQVINLSDVYKSARWNPFSGVLTKQKMIDGLGIQKHKNKYLVFGQEFDSLKQAEQALPDYADQIVERRNELTDKIQKDIKDLVFTMCPIRSQGEPTWENSARNFVAAMAVALWEDVRDKKIRPEQFNLFNLYQNIVKYATGDFKEMTAYFETRDEFSQSRGLAKTILTSEERTLSSYLGNVNEYVSFISDRGVQSLTSGNDIDFSNFDERPTVLFVKVPDADKTRHALVSLLLVQMYKGLVDKSDDNRRKGKTKGEELLRSTYFIMDEFGNLPKLEDIDSIITVGRSRKIFMVPIIQDFNQLDNKYEKKIAAIVKSNCNIKIFIGAGDSTTTEEFSKLCGKRKIVKKSFSENKDTSISASAEERPLITPHELQNLNDPNAGKMGNAIVLALGKDPIKAKFTPCFQASKIYQMSQSALTDVKQPPFDEKALYYDIAKSSEKIPDDEGEILTENVSEPVSEPEDVEDRLRPLLEKRFAALKNKLQPFLSKQEFRLLSESDPITVLEFLEEFIEKMVAKDIVAGVAGVELKQFILTKLLEDAEVDEDMNSS